MNSFGKSVETNLNNFYRDIFKFDKLIKKSFLQFMVGLLGQLQFQRNLSSFYSDNLAYKMGITHNFVQSRKLIKKLEVDHFVKSQVRVGQVRFGQVRLGLVWLGYVWLGQVWLGQFWLGQVWLGQVWLGQVWLDWDGLGWVGLGQVRLGQVRLGQVYKKPKNIEHFKRGKNFF